MEIMIMEAGVVERSKSQVGENKWGSRKETGFAFRNTYWIKCVTLRHPVTYITMHRDIMWKRDTPATTARHQINLYQIQKNSYRKINDREIEETACSVGFGKG